ncbi:MAG: uracil-DNA glycosylase [Thiohalospira sp.]
MTRADCWKCRHHYITWEESFPYGCRALGFKSRRLPVFDVRESSGHDCLYFSPREGKG